MRCVRLPEEVIRVLYPSKPKKKILFSRSRLGPCGYGTYMVRFHLYAHDLMLPAPTLRR